MKIRASNCARGLGIFQDMALIPDASGPLGNTAQVTEQGHRVHPTSVLWLLLLPAMFKHMLVWWGALCSPQFLGSASVLVWSNLPEKNVAAHSLPGR